MSILPPRVARAFRDTKIFIVILILFTTMHELRFAKASLVPDRWKLEERRHRESERRPLDPRFFLERYCETPYLSVPDDDYSYYDYTVEDPARNVAKRVALDVESSSRMLSKSGLACSCESRYDIKDLGEGHYPRYLTISHCKPRSCQSKFHSCRLLHYTVHVLKKREANGSVSENDEFLETPLPESLRSEWQLMPTPVAVACVSSSGNRRN